MTFNMDVVQNYLSAWALCKSFSSLLRRSLAASPKIAIPLIVFNNVEQAIFNLIYFIWNIPFISNGYELKSTHKTFIWNICDVTNKIYRIKNVCLHFSGILETLREGMRWVSQMHSTQKFFNLILSGLLQFSWKNFHKYR